MSINNPLISVVVPFKDAGKHFGALLSSLKTQTFKNVEYILVNNNSTDNSCSIVEDFSKQNPDMNIRLIHETKPGPGFARNKGVSEAQGDWIAFVDSDCIADTLWLEKIAESIEDRNNYKENVVAFACQILPAKSKNIIAKFLGVYTFPVYSKKITNTHKSYLNNLKFPTANFVIQKKIFNELGGFDERFRFFGEDHFLCMQIYEKGYAIQCLPDAIVEHDHRSTLKSFIKQSSGFGSAHAQLYKMQNVDKIAIDLPFFRIRNNNIPFKAWIDFNQADMKVLAIILVSFVFRKSILLLPLYLLFAMFSMHRVARKRTTSLKISELFPCILLLIIKSGAMTWGRIKGAIKHKVLVV